MTALTKQDEARIVELGKLAERFMGRGKFGLLDTPARMRGECLRRAELASAEAFRIATSARTALRALCEAGYAPVSELVACGGGR